MACRLAKLDKDPKEIAFGMTCGLTKLPKTKRKKKNQIVWLLDQQRETKKNWKKYEMAWFVA